MLEPIFKNAKVGDKVIAYGAGRGVIDSIDGDRIGYPINVKFENGLNCYEVDGRLCAEDIAPTCFPIDKAPQHLLEMFPEPKVMREYETTAWGLFDPESSMMVDIKRTRAEAEEFIKYLIPTAVIVEVHVSFELEVTA